MLFNNNNNNNNNTNYYTLKISKRLQVQSEIEMFIPFVVNDNETIISRTEPAILKINNDKFSISYGDYIELFNTVSARDVYALKESFEYNEIAFLNFLNSIDCCEMTDLSIEDVRTSNCVYFIKENKLMKIDEEEPGYGWREVEENTYCLCPLLDYIIWGSIYDGPIKILKY